ncbi:glycosyltransferase family 39 protein [Chloracidobacterium sp. MS 40/45]|uniref:ArnT family glycosyltransferase n=1 Tax=Chloracidobacterium aggregatum TaxID=2851959 RepID=UPI001B8C7D86|nr:glycosyltransferase family 39 protein [Chloracidobacterium aggregatum]QUW00501.1 glycosyltransferase family 39 protein [Chloracidobacterium sp. MS 40/45]
MWFIAPGSALIGGLTLAWVSAYGWTNLYGDGQAHLAIARKLVDVPPGTTWWERYIQLGSPWLPLPHVLAAPLSLSDTLWRTGLAGSLISCLAFVVAATVVFQLAAALTRSLPAALVAWLAFALNPSLLYVQTTPLTEPLFLATWLGSAWWMHDWTQHGRRDRLVLAALCTLGALLTRYEGWILFPAGMLWVLWSSPRRGWARLTDLGLWAGIVGAGVVYWLWHNWAIYGRPLEFLEGTYSARGYFARHRDELSYLSFVVGRPLYAGLVLAVTVVICATPATTLLGLLGLAGQAVAAFRARWPDVSTLAVLGWLWLPPLFTGYSLYSGNIQIYPLFLNNRYGLAALPLLALGVGLGVAYGQARFPTRQVWVAVGVGLVCAGQSLWWLRDGVYQLAVFQEAYRAQFAPLGCERRALAQFLQSDPALQSLKRRQAGVCVALFAGELSAVIAQGGLSYAHILHEGRAGWHSLEKSIPSTVTWLVVGRGDELERKLQQRPAGYEEFTPVWVSEQGTFRVLSRNRPAP